MGFSIAKVFKPIEAEMKKYASVERIELPCADYSLRSMIRNVSFAVKTVNSKHYDIVHITGAEYYLLPFLREQNTVVTVHDLGFFTNHKLGLRAIYKYVFWVRTLKYASYVTFISKKSEYETLSLVKLRFKKYGIVPNPVSNEFEPNYKKINTQYPVILQIGTGSNKNIYNTAVALKGFPCKLRVVGTLTNGQIHILSECKINYITLSKLTDEEILQEYIRCDYVNFPSLYEGFGMPIIEGQAVGRPVLTSNLSPMKEVAGDAAILVDPRSPDDIRRGYEKMKDEAGSLVEKGFKNVERFSSREIALEYFRIYEGLI